MIHVEDKTLVLPDGRTLAYADNGNTSSSDLVLYFHGAFSVADANRLPRVLLERNVHFIAPTLPGWGKSSPVPCSRYAATLAADITALITHLHPHTRTPLRLYLCAHALGTVPAQILYGLAHDAFPLGRRLAALVLLSPLSPPHLHTAYARALPWPAYLLAGPPSRYAPFNLLAHLARLCIANLLASDSAAEDFIRRHTIDPMDDDERDAFAAWRDEHALAPAQFERALARNASRSVAHSWRGFLDFPALYHSGWGGFAPHTIESTCPVLVVSPQNDRLMPREAAQWLVSTYNYARLKTIPGSHLASFFHLDDIWDQVFAMESDPEYT
ncbi:hypothetical protein H0H81_008100 [Sphagnurus paluster]|uniref:AB hydrolase-1 domain-containing protein n=1 Tax=Sphagnurus paluster TaxID=117069 RepID=A0A9P7FSE4_9AGAR|nr:hypothetical protein H0H81_008100 [Sphagnurus paluster]